MSLFFDKTNNLVWQDNLLAETTKLEYEDAIIHCKNLKLGNYDDWRLPTYYEILSIGDKEPFSPSINTIFQYVFSGHYWASTPISSESDFIRDILYLSQPGIFWSKNKGLKTHHARRYFFRSSNLRS